MTGRQLRRGNWAVQEMERLRQLLPRRGVPDTALLLRRSVASVFRKAMDLLRVPARRGPWTASDDARLRDSWGAVDPRLLGPMLGRPIVDVKKRACELRGRMRTGPWSREDLQALKDLYGTRRDDDLEIALARPRAEVASMAQQLCLAKDKKFAANSARDSTAREHDIQGIHVSPHRCEMPRWTHEQVEKLRVLYADRDNLSVAREIGRTVASVANKANLLGLKKSAGLLADIGRANVASRYQILDSNGERGVGAD